MSTHEERVAALRREAETCAAQDENLPAKYFAGWVVFLIDQHEHTVQAWQASIDQFGTRYAA